MMPEDHEIDRLREAYGEQFGVTVEHTYVSVDVPMVNLKIYRSGYEDEIFAVFPGHKVPRDNIESLIDMIDRRLMDHATQLKKDMCERYENK